VILSFIFIFLVHHLITFFKNTLTTPKIKDLVNIHTEKYDAIYDVIHRHSSAREKEKGKEGEKEKEVIELSSLLPIQEQAEPSMKDELKSFLKKQMQTSPHVNDLNSSTSIDFLDSKTEFSYLS
jgi:hypothetical protein